MRSLRMNLNEGSPPSSRSRKLLTKTPFALQLDQNEIHFLLYLLECAPLYRPASNTRIRRLCRMQGLQIEFQNTVRYDVPICCLARIAKEDQGLAKRPLGKVKQFLIDIANPTDLFKSFFKIVDDAANS